MLSRAKVIVCVIGLVFGIPVSYLGWQLKQGMLAKQMINCGEDATNSLMSLYEHDPTSIRANDIQNISNGLKKCRGDIDPMIGTVEFLRKEHERNLKDATK